MPEIKGGIVRQHSAALVELNRVADGLLIILSMWLSCFLLDVQWDNTSLVLSLTSVAIFTLAAGYNTLYRSWRSMSLVIEVSRIWLCWTVTATIFGLIIFLFEQQITFSREAVILWFVLAPIIISFTRITIRLTLRSIRVSGRNFRTAAIIGVNHAGERVDYIISNTAWMGIKLIGYYDDRVLKDRLPEHFDSSKIKGTVDDLVELTKTGEIDSIFITLPMRAESRIKQIIDRFSDTTAKIYFVPDIFTFDLLHSEWDTLDGLPIVSIVNTPFYGTNSLAKRLEDIILSTLILSLVAIPMIVIIAAIKLTSPGPALYRQKRYGLDGREFEIWKFRTMKFDKDDIFVQATLNDSRITRIGAFLRATSIDELPQFINVLQGSMSIVGPRPHPVDLNEQHRRLIHRYMVRHVVKPGITGWAQVNGFRGETDTIDKMQKRIDHDLDYICNWSLLLDLKIIFLTMLRGFHGRNTY